MSTDATITSVANGGSPQPVKVQPASPTSKEAIDAIANEVTGEFDLTDDDTEGLDDAEEAIEAAEEAGKISQQQAQSLKKKLKLKVDGEEFEEEVDFNDEENLKKHFQKSRAFDKRVKEFQGFKGQVDEMLALVKEDPAAFLEKMGLNADDFAEKRLAKKVEEMSKSPQQLASEKMEKELADAKKKIKQIEDEKQQSELEKQRNQEASQIQDEIMGALESAKTKLPKKNPFVYQKIAQNMLLAMKNGYPNVTVKDVLPVVEKQWSEEIRSYFDSSSEDIIEELIGKSNLDRLRKKRLSARPKTTTAKQAVKDVGSVKREEEKPKAPKSFKKLFSYHDE